MLKILYVLSLEENKYFVYYTISGQYEAVMLECQLLNPFVRKYKPKNVMEQKSYVELEDIDKYVKKYMNIFGIENVRGGSYSNENLEDFQIKALEKELYFLKTHENNNNDMYLFLYKEILNYKDIHEIEKFDIQKNKYIEDTRELEKFQYYKFNDKQCKIDFSSIQYIQWMRNMIGQYNVEYEFLENCNSQYSNKGIQKVKRKINNVDVQKYKEIIQFFIHLTKLNCEYRETEINFEPLLYLTNPIVILDNYIFSNDISLKNRERKIAINVCNKFEEFFYWTINRICELEFNVTNAVTNLENKSNLVHYVYNEKTMSQKMQSPEMEEE